MILKWRELLNPQNITNPDRCQDPDQRELAYMVRSCIVPKSKGNERDVLVTVDACQIEARITAWLAGEESLLRDFREGGDPYSSFISNIVREPVFKPTKDTDPETAKRVTALRNVGKEAILGLGFQMGAYRFFDRLKAHPEAGTIREVLGDKLDLEFAKELVNTYRTKYSKIADSWDRLNKIFHQCRKDITKPISERRHRDDRLGLVRFAAINKPDDGFCIYLPSKRCIRYYNIRQKTDSKGRKNWVHGLGRKVFGGLLMENLAQGIARDILCEAVLKLESEGYPVILTTHDDIKLQVPESKGQECLDRTIELLSTTPVWGRRLPLAAEGKISYDFN